MFIYIFLFSIVAIIAIVNLYPAFGGKPNQEHISIYKSSPNYKNGKFQNLTFTKMDFRINEKYKSNFISKHSISKTPKNILPNIKFDKTKFIESNEDLITWFGHSTILLKLAGKSILIDPVFNRASPFPFLLGPTPFKYENIQLVEDLPNNIDIVLITHDHYDHLDYRTIKRIHTKVGKFFVPFGVKAHLLRWGIKNDKIFEFDWYNTKSFDQIEFIFTPSRHFSGRAFRDRFATLWGGWVIRSQTNRLFISGDGGYSKGFINIGNEYGPFDLIFIENGAYNPRWYNVHLFPEEGVQVSMEVNAKYALPIHWGKFNLSFHTWTEPIERFVIEAENKKLSVITPLIGQTFILNKELPNERWWENLD